jgi:hypothetical protein
MRYYTEFARTSDLLSNIIYDNKKGSVPNRSVEDFIEAVRASQAEYIVLGYLDEKSGISCLLRERKSYEVLNFNPHVTRNPVEMKILSKQIMEDFERNQTSHSNSFAINGYLDLEILMTLRRNRLAVLRAWKDELSVSSIIRGYEVEIYMDVLRKLQEEKREIDSNDIIRTKELLGRGRRI